MHFLKKDNILGFSWHSKLESIILALVMGTLLLKESYNGIVLIIYLAFWTITKRYKHIDIESLKKIRGYFLLVFVCLVWVFIRNFASLEWPKATNFLLKQITILIFPVLLGHNFIGNKEKNIMDRLFFYTIFVYVCYLYIGTLFKFMEYGRWYEIDPEHPTWKYYFYISARLSPEVHPTFLSMFIVYCIYTYLPVLKNVQKRYRKVIDYSIILVLLMTLLLLSSRGALISFLFVFVVYQGIRIVKGQYKRIVYLGIIGCMGVAVFLNSGPLNRISKLQHLKGLSAIEIAKTPNSSGKRLQIYLIAGQMVKDNFWAGIGTKNWPHMNKEYYLKNYSEDFEYAIETLNTHNQYLNALVSWGIIGLLFFVSIMVFQIYYAQSYKIDDGMLLFWCFMACLLMTENIINRHRGIIFFSLISAFTIKQFLDHKKGMVDELN